MLRTRSCGLLHLLLITIQVNVSTSMCVQSAGQYSFTSPYRHRSYIIQHPKCCSQWLCGWHLRCFGDYTNVPAHCDNCGSTSDCAELAIHHMSDQVWPLFPQHQETAQVLTNCRIVTSYAFFLCIIMVSYLYYIMLFFHCFFF